MTQEMKTEMIWAYLIHLSYNMWCDRDAPEWDYPHVAYRPHLRCEIGMWNLALHTMADHGVNMAVIDLGDAVKYESHPEIAVKRAWSPQRLTRELARIRKLGIEPIPKLNFSASHDVWLGPYSRMVSTDTYYAVCRELIAEVIELFDKPRFFHLGMDEETASHQRHQEYVVLRQKDLWWHDLHFYLDEVEKGGVRPWIWSDYVWHHPEEFYQRMPTSVLQSNWYYEETGQGFSTSARRNRHAFIVRSFLELAQRGYDQVPCGSIWKRPENFEDVAAYCRKRIPPERLKGFLQTVWKPTLTECRRHHLAAIRRVELARKQAEGGS